MENIKDITIKKDVSLKNYNTYKIVSKSDYLIEVSSIEGLINLIKYLKEKNIDFMILGNGSNVILDDYFKGAIIKLSGFYYVNINNKIVVVGAGTMMAKLTMSTINENLTGLEWAVNIPGTIGGSIVGNAGAYNSEIFDNLISIKVLNNDFKIVDMSKDKFIDRKSVV